MRDGAGRLARLTRRDLIVGAGVSALALTAPGGVAETPAIASGTVFEDRGGTGIRRSGDPGISGVLVSNGRDVVRTDADGRWRLPVLDGDSLFVVKPRGWTTPTGPNGLPRFSYLHQPLGTPASLPWHHRGVAPTGPLPASIDLPLQRQHEDARFEALLLADTQPENEGELAYLRDDILAATLPIGAAFALVHGDVVADDFNLYPRYLGMLAATDIPWHHCPGNHDMNLDARDDQYSRETWKRVFGPRHYAFQYSGATFLVLDNVHYRGWNPGRPLSGTYCGRIGTEQLAFVRNMLAHVPPNELVVLSMHIPLTTSNGSGNDPANPADNTEDYRTLLALLSGRPHTVSFSGHMHTAERHDLGVEHGFAGPGRHMHQVLAAASGGWWGGPRDCDGMPNAVCPDGTPNGFHVLAVDGASFSTRFVPAASKGSAQMRVMIDGPQRRLSASDTGSVPGGPIDVAGLDAHSLVVNVFDGGPGTEVTYQVSGPGGPEVALHRADMADPNVARLIATHPATFKSWVRAVPSSHIWRAPLPAGLGPGAHRLTVRARQPEGTRHTAHIVLEVAAPSGASRLG